MRCETRLDPVCILLYMRIIEGHEKQNMSTTFDYHPDPYIALRLASVGFSSGKGASKVGLMRQYVDNMWCETRLDPVRILMEITLAIIRVRPGISTTVGCSTATCKARKGPWHKTATKHRNGKYTYAHRAF